MKSKSIKFRALTLSLVVFPIHTVLAAETTTQVLDRPVTTSLPGQDIAAGLGLDKPSPDICGTILANMEQTGQTRQSNAQLEIAQNAQSFVEKLFSQQGDLTGPQAYSEFLSTVDTELDEQVGLTETLNQLNSGQLMEMTFGEIEKRAKAAGKIYSEVQNINIALGSADEPSEDESVITRYARRVPVIGRIVSHYNNKGETVAQGTERMRMGLQNSIESTREMQDYLRDQSVVWLETAQNVGVQADYLLALRDGFYSASQQMQAGSEMHSLSLIISDRLGDYEESYRFIQSTLLTASSHATDVHKAQRGQIHLARTQGMTNIGAIQVGQALQLSQSVARDLMEKTKLIRDAASRVELAVAADYKDFTEARLKLLAEGPRDPKLAKKADALWNKANRDLEAYEAKQNSQREQRLQALRERNARDAAGLNRYNVTAQATEAAQKNAKALPATRSP